MSAMTAAPNAADGDVPVLEGSRLARVFRDGGRKVVAVDDVSVSIARGRTLGVVGESGSGKSTLGEMMGGLLKPTGGRVSFHGVDISAMDRRGREAFRRGVQFVFQDPVGSMNPGFTILRVLEDPLLATRDKRSRAERRRACEEALDQAGLPASILARHPGELSGGQAQRVAIARALMLSPQVLICDECTSALDVSVQAQILNLLRDIQARLGTSLLFVSHDMAAVSCMADEIAVMKDGRVVECGACADVLGSPRDPYTKLLLSSAEAMLP